MSSAMLFYYMIMFLNLEKETINLQYKSKIVQY